MKCYVFMAFVLNLSAHVAGKAWVPKKIVDPIMENVTLEPELEEALASASDAELCDIAGSIHSHLLTAHTRLIAYICSCFSLDILTVL